MQRLDWDDLRVFLAIARSKTLSGAARKLGVNQTTVTRRLDALEARLGARLFDRSPSGISPTSAATEVLHVAERVEDNVASIERQLIGQDTRLTGELRVTTIDMSAYYDADLFESFAQRYPDIELELSVGHFLRNLTRREADVAIRWTDKPPEHLVGQRVARAEYAVYGARPLLDKHGADAKLNDFPWVDWDVANNARVTARWMRNHVPDAHVVCRYDMALALHGAIKAGTGLGFMPCAYGDSDPSLCRMRPPEAGFGMDIWLLTHPDLRSTARVRAFMRHASAYFETNQQRFAGATIPVQNRDASR
ncbi:MAG: LysR family transcriptional regulator [Betaproteobacteria bacterium]|nr:MAG: LysR family transcriptional regulator [Betaproteobacteria bacterium]